MPPKVSSSSLTLSWSSLKFKSSTMLLQILLLATVTSTTFGSTTIPTGAQAHVVSATEDAEMEIDTYKSIEHDFEYDENNKLASYYIVFPAGRPDCSTANMHRTTPNTGFKFAAIEGAALQRVFPDYKHNNVGTGTENDQRCLAACLERGTDIKFVGYTMPHFHFEVAHPPVTQTEKHQFFLWYKDSCRQVEVCLINYVQESNIKLRIFWIPENQAHLPRNDDLTKKHLQTELQYGERKTNCFKSYIGHEFEAYGVIIKNNDNDEDDDYEEEDDDYEIDEVKFYERVVIEHVTTKAFGSSPPSSSKRYENENDLEREVERTLETEWSKHKKVERTFSSLGFAKGRLPDDVFANMAAFYYNNRNNVVNEEWNGKGLFVNWWDTDVKFVGIPWGMKKVWQLRLMDLVSAWSGVEVEETSMYGLRQYETGARLLSHVDRLPTHAVSLIVNVAQENLASPWPVEVFDHADRLHEIDMIPGDIVYYESAKNLHGRNRPLTCKHGGCKFVNLFTHYRPKADGDRWHKVLDDVPNRPAPVLHGQVEFDTDKTRCDNDHQIHPTDNALGIGTVDCGTDRRLGSYISPTLFTANSADHLLKWWKETADPYYAGDDDSELDSNNSESSSGSGTPSTNKVGNNVNVDEHDSHEKCGEWARVGECESNPGYMVRNCAASCSNGSARASASSFSSTDEL